MCFQQLRAFFCVVAMVGLAAAKPASAIGAEESPPTKEEVIALMEQRPLTTQTWPAWRDFYVRLYYAYDVDEPEDFYRRLYVFIGLQGAQNCGQLGGVFSEDPIAWILLTQHYLRARSPRAEEAGRKALSLGDPSAMSSFNLVAVLLQSTHKRPQVELTREDRALLDEVEERLRLVERTVPQARLNWFYGLLAGNRREKETAAQFLKQATIESPRKLTVAIAYLSAWFSTLNAQTGTPRTSTTETYVIQFPDNPHILAFHAMALYEDERYADAYETLQKVRHLDESAPLEILGDRLTAVIDDGRFFTPDVLEGLELQKQKKFHESIVKFEKALQGNPENLFAARFMARSLVANVRNASDSVDAASACKSLCDKFPNDAELHIARAVALSHGRRPVAAYEALQRGQDLGGDLEKMLGAPFTQKIRDEAAHAEVVRKIWWVGFIGLIGVAGWIISMFAIGALLASFVARQADPDPLTILEEGLSARELWVERAYVLVLTIGLIIFYLSLPVVSLGLLGIILAMFFLMIVFRVVHLGILYRGFFAVSSVVRSATIGPSREILGIEVREEQHPRLFEVFNEVADRLQTQPADSVYLTPLAGISVHDRGHGPFGLFGTRRVIEIGIPTFSCLTVSELKSVLAHEFAHFSHQHTFYSRFIFQVSAPLSHSLWAMNAAGGELNYVNPFYGFYWLYLKAFDLLAAGFSRSHEFLADRRAAFAYGRGIFQSSFAKINVETGLFQGTVVQTVKHALIQGQTYVNVFDVLRQNYDHPEAHEIRQRLLDNLMQKQPCWYDSHPTYTQRLRAVESIPDLPHATDLTPSTNLLDDIGAIEIQLSDVLTRQISKVCDILELPAHLRVA